MSSLPKKRFNPEQVSFQTFARRLKDGYSKVVVWSGAGVSKPGNCPNWPERLNFVKRQAEIKAEASDNVGKQLMQAMIRKADDASSFWERFSILKKAIGHTTFPMAIREAFSRQSKSAPKFYSDMWRLGVRGYITTNLDRFAISSTVDADIPTEVEEFDGKQSGDYAWILRKPQKFVLNVHGRLETDSSWVLTAEDLEKLKKLPEYWALLESLLRDSVVLFAGCSPEDVSVAAHLENLKETGLRLEGHFWLTHRNDQAADEWAEKNGLARILFDAQGEVYDGIGEFIVELKKFATHDVPPPIVIPPDIADSTKLVLATADELRIEPSVNKVRIILNAEAKRILTSGKSQAEINQEYDGFISKYEEALHRAWFISAAGGSELFDLQIYEPVKKGAFGQVYEAIDQKGNRVAVKVLHGNIKDDPRMLTCFRRGVDAMRLLSKYKVEGIIPYLNAWEIPTCAVMDFVDGLNLQEAVERGQVNSWNEILRVSYTISKIIKAAHSTPAGVLHRDLRPANIMIESKEDAPNRKVLILDFDLCWHHDALDANSLHLNAEANNGYLSPEQLDPARHHLTRKPLVDSFGLGMVFYFMMARKHPEINQNMFKTWGDVLTSLAIDRPCKEWKSAPFRYVKIIQNCTQDEQSSRWDISRIVNETSLLSEVVSGRRGNITAEFLAEELFCRVPGAIGRYDFLPNQDSIRLQPRDGYEIVLKWVEKEKKVVLKIQWLQTGSLRYETLKKYIGDSTESASKALRNGMWYDVRTSFATGGLMIDAFVDTAISGENELISRAADAVTQVIENLRKLAARST